MAIQQAEIESVKIDADTAVHRAKARGAQITAASHAARSKRQMNKPQPRTGA